MKIDGSPIERALHTAAQARQKAAEHLDTARIRRREACQHQRDNRFADARRCFSAAAAETDRAAVALDDQHIALDAAAEVVRHEINLAKANTRNDLSEIGRCRAQESAAA